jgi:hypothetical protein
MQVKHSISIIKPDGKTTAHIVDGEWNEEESGGPSFKPLYKLLDCKLIEIAYGMDLENTKEYPMFLDEEGLYKEKYEVNNKATFMQAKWCRANGRMQISPIIGDVAVDLGLSAESLTEVSTEMELQNNERKDNTTEA